MWRDGFQVQKIILDLFVHRKQDIEALLEKS